MDQPMTRRSKPLEKRFSGLSSAQATEETIRRCPCVDSKAFLVKSDSEGIFFQIYLSTVPREPRDALTIQIEESNVPIVVRNRDDAAV